MVCSALHEFTGYMVAISAFITVIIAFLSYRLTRIINKKIEKPIIEKQLNILYAFIEGLQEMKIELAIESDVTITGIDTRSQQVIYQGSFFNLCSTSDKYSNYEKFPLITEQMCYENLDFFNFSRNPFMPKSIAQSIRKLEVDFNNLEKVEKRGGDYIIIGNKDDTFYGDKSLFYLKNSNINTFGDLIKIFKDITLQLDKWINNPRKELNLL